MFARKITSNVVTGAKFSQGLPDFQGEVRSLQTTLNNMNTLLYGPDPSLPQRATLKNASVGEEASHRF